MEFTHTNLPVESEFPKLVRDNIPSIIERNEGKKPQVEVLEDDEVFLRALLKKMIEEAAELQHSVEQGNTQEELADIFEIADAVMKLKGWARKDIEAIQQRKREKNGGFDKRFLALGK